MAAPKFETKQRVIFTWDRRYDLQTPPLLQLDPRFPTFEGVVISWRWIPIYGAYAHIVKLDGWMETVECLEPALSSIVVEAAVVESENRIGLRREEVDWEKHKAFMNERR